MTAATKYTLYLVFLHLLLAAAAYLYFDGKGLWVLAAEALILFSAYLAFRLYRSIITPVRLLSQGAAALRDRDFSVRLMPTGSPEVDALVDLYNRMIDQLRSERVSSRQQEEFLAQLLAAAEVGVLILDFDGKEAERNDWLREQEQRAGFRTAVTEPALAMAAGEQRVVTGPGNRRLRLERGAFIDRGFERGFIVIQDVTANLLSAEKEAYGKVIRMMAHEVNNSNAAIVSLLGTLVDASEDAAENTTEVVGLNREFLPVVIERANNMTAFMRNFARVVRLPSPQLETIYLIGLVRSVSQLMAKDLEVNNISLELELPERKVIISADAGQLEQVIINAIVNARESILGADGGVSPVALREGRGQIQLSVSTNPTCLTIADDGPGIDPQTADRLFTPFFSNKPTGQGVGLTLSRDILEAHGARYGLATEADGWTRFRIWFD